MIRHISIFFLNDPARDSEAMLQLLRDVEPQLTDIVDYKVGCSVGAPDLPDLPGVPKFGHVAQIIDFATVEAAAGYGAHPAHQALVKASDGMVKQVVAMDFEW